MQLKNNLYTIEGVENDGKTTCFHLRLNPSSVIYQAHFPNEPITPGVCIVQIAKELIEEVLQCRLDIAVVKNVKFLSVLSPNETTEVIFHIQKLTVSEDTSEVKSQVDVLTDKEMKAKVSLVCKRHGSH